MPVADRRDGLPPTRGGARGHDRRPDPGRRHTPAGSRGSGSPSSGRTADRRA